MLKKFAELLEREKLHGDISIHGAVEDLKDVLPELIKAYGKPEIEVIRGSTPSIPWVVCLEWKFGADDYCSHVDVRIWVFDFSTRDKAIDFACQYSRTFIVKEVA